MNRNETEFFDRIASRWDSMEHISTPERTGRLLDLLGVKPGMRVLDLGTGTGVLLGGLLRRVRPGGHVTGVDISAGMLGEARRKYSPLPADLELVRTDFEVNPLPGSYDLIMLYCVLPHIHDVASTLRRLVTDNLAPGGRLVIAFPTDNEFINNIHHERKVESDLLPPPAELAARLRRYGLDAAEYPDPDGGYVVTVSGTAECAAPAVGRAVECEAV